MYRRKRSRTIPLAIAGIVVFAVVFVIARFWIGGSHANSVGAASTTDQQAGSVSPIEVADTKAAIGRQNRAAGPASPSNATSKSNGSTTETKISMGDGLRSTPNHAEPAAVAPPPPAAPVIESPAAPAQTPIAAAVPAAMNVTEESPSKPAVISHPSARESTGLDLLARGKSIEARKTLTEALVSERLPAGEAAKIRETLTTLSDKLVFGSEALPGDPLARFDTIESGDVLAKLPRKLGLKVDYRFLQRINNLPNDKLRAGQRLKVVAGPFHVVIVKNEFRMDLYEGEGDQRVYVRSYPVGLGEYGATPEGVFAVRPNSKLIDPTWVNPRTGQKFESNDPLNPIGERWIGLIGVSENIRDLSGYGIHGTIDPDSIGKQKSMGCIRMRAGDVEVVYELLLEQVSRIEIHGEDYP
jgi:L,D-transpeptidase catalytic domain/LysM domain